MDSKQCTKCRTVKPVTDFYTQKQGRYLQSWCKQCKLIQVRQIKAQRQLPFEREQRLMPTYGETHHHAKLTAHDVDLIRGLLDDGISCADVGRKFEVSRTTISAIKNFRSWWRN